MQQQVNPAGTLVAQLPGQRRLREQADGEAWAGICCCAKTATSTPFHVHRGGFQSIQPHQSWNQTERANHVLVAAARYLAAHAPTMRSQLQTYTIARRLSHGENLFEE